MTINIHYLPNPFARAGCSTRSIFKLNLTVLTVLNSALLLLNWLPYEDLPKAMNDREEWRERVRDIRATSAI